MLAQQMAPDMVRLVEERCARLRFFFGGVGSDGTGYIGFIQVPYCLILNWK